jgi:hypothetical protein
MGLREYWVSGEFVSVEMEYAGDPIITATKINESPVILGLWEYWVSGNIGSLGILGHREYWVSVRN